MAKFPVLSTKIPSDYAAEKLVETLEHAVKVLDSAGISSKRITANLYEGDPHLAWLSIDNVPVYRAVLLPDVKDNLFAVVAHGTWLPAYQDYVDAQPDWETPPEPEDDDQGDAGDTDPDIQVN